MTIDWWTLGLQTVNIAILVWLLGRFFWRPVAGMIAQRRQAAQLMLDDAQAKQTQATAALTEIERTRAGFAAERAALLAQAVAEAGTARTALLAEAGKQAAAVTAAAQAAVLSEQAAAEAALRERASRLAIEIAQRLAARLDGAAVRASFLDWLLRELRALPDAVRQSVAADAAPLQATTASAMDAAEQAQCREAIVAALGAAPPIVFAADPALIAGLELQGPHLVVRNSWRADLARILDDISHAPRQ